MSRILLIACGTFPGDFTAPYVARALALYHAYQTDELEIILPSTPATPWQDEAAHPCYHASSYPQYRDIVAPLLACNDMALVFFYPSNPRQARCLQVLCDLAYPLQKPLYPQVIVTIYGIK